MTKKIARTVFELWCGCLIFGVLCELGLFFVHDRATYSICLWIGILTAMACAFHMWWSIDRAIDAGEGEAAKKINVQYIIRYFVLVIILGLVGMNAGSYVLATFLGMCSIKVSAYIEPFTKKISKFFYGPEILQPVIENLDEYEEEMKKLQNLQKKGGE